jgi:hypothetical protein
MLAKKNPAKAGFFFCGWGSTRISFHRAEIKNTPQKVGHF